jgi:single stranded DNA-binding protein
MRFCGLRKPSFDNPYDEVSILEENFENINQGIDSEHFSNPQDLKQLVFPDVNRVAIVGKLLHDPPIRWTKKGVPVTNFLISTSPDAEINLLEQDNRESCQVSVVVWANQAIQCNKYLRKGQCVLILGELQSMPNYDPGKSHYPIQVNAQWIQYLDKETTPRISKEEGLPQPTE